MEKCTWVLFIMISLVFWTINKLCSRGERDPYLVNALLCSVREFDACRQRYFTII